MRSAVFLDRDGVINKVIIKDGHPFSPRRIDDFELLPGVIDAVKLLKSIGLFIIVVTNQPDIARGKMDMETLQTMHRRMFELLMIDDIYVCPHDDEEGCNCRKPKPGLLMQAAKKWNIDLRTSYLVGDSWKDIEAGRRVDCTTFLIDRPYNKKVREDAKFLVNNLDSVAQTILRLKSGGTK